MKLIDVNILIYAINQSDPRHQIILKWWQAALDFEEPVGITWQVALGFLRISTNPHALSRPWSTHEAVSQLDEWLSLANVAVIEESDEHWTILKRLMVQPGLIGNLISDAHLAAIAIGAGAILVSCDTDFARFAGLSWENPLVQV